LKVFRGRAAQVSWIHDSKLYIHGGYDTEKEINGKAEVLSDMYSYDFEKKEESLIKYKNNLENLERRWHCSFQIEDKLFIHGGWNKTGPLSELLCFELATQKWTKNRMFKLSITKTLACNNYRY